VKNGAVKKWVLISLFQTKYTVQIVFKMKHIFFVKIQAAPVIRSLSIPGPENKSPPQLCNMGKVTVIAQFKPKMWYLDSPENIFLRTPPSE